MAQTGGGFDSAINEWTEPLASALKSIVFFKLSFFGVEMPLVVLWLVAGGIFFTFRMGFVGVRGFKQAIALIRGGDDEPAAPGEVTHFQALATAVSGTVGIGNIGGVAIAVTVGGAGATFWIIFAGFLGMSTKFVECTLGVKYRSVNADGSVSGGPMYYLDRGLAKRGLPRLGRAMGIFYATGIFIGALGIGNMFQSNQAYVQLNQVTGGAFDGLGWLVGLVMAAIVGVVIVGGIRSIAKTTEKIVPLMAVSYCFFALVVIGMNWAYIPEAIASIFSTAFTGEGVAGGALGAMVIGFQRAVFSNEAGIGSASIAHSAVRTDEPVTEGLVSILEPFIDTIVICTITALVIATSSVADPGFADGTTGIAMTSAAFARQISWFPVPLSIAALLFAFSTTISWSYYGLKGWTYLFGEGMVGQLFYKSLFCGCVVLGCMVSLEPILDISDALVFLICIPNILGLYFLSGEVREDYRRYLQKG